MRGQRQRRKTKPNNSIKSSQVQLISSSVCFHSATLFKFRHFAIRTARFQLFALSLYSQLIWPGHKSAENGDNLNDISFFFVSTSIYLLEEREKM